MIDLTSQKWSKLTHAYGQASKIPELLKKLEDYPKKNNWKSEPYFSLWSALCHQGDVYSASYAAVPHILSLALLSPSQISYDYLLLPTSIEIARVSGRGPDLPPEYEPIYLSSLSNIPKIVGAIGAKRLDETWPITCAAAIAIAGGQTKIAQAILELEGDVPELFLKWIENQ